MAKGFYCGVDAVAKKGKKGYIGVDNVARKIKKAYIGVEGVARLAWNSEYTTAVASSGTLPDGFRFLNTGTDAVVPQNGNVLEVFTGILPYNSKSYLYNISENTLTETDKTATVNLNLYEGHASEDGYMYFIHKTAGKAYKMKQSDFSVVLSADIDIDSDFYIESKCIADVGDYVYYFLDYASGDDYVVRLYKMDKSTLELTYMNMSFTVSEPRYLSTVVHDGSLHLFQSSGTSGKNFFGFKYDLSAGTRSQVVFCNNTPFGVGLNALRAMELDGETYIFAGSHYQTATKVYKVDYENQTVKLFAELGGNMYIENWWHNGNGTVVSTYNSASTGTFTTLEFK